MAQPDSQFDPSHYPPDLIRSVVEIAETDAIRVGEFLDRLAPDPPSDLKPRYSAEFLLDLGAALRLCFWEQEGLAVHRTAGLPAAEEAIRLAFSDGTSPEESPSRSNLRLSRRVLDVAVERFAWTGRRDLGAEVILETTDDEDSFTEAVSPFLWANRNRPI